MADSFSLPQLEFPSRFKAILAASFLCLLAVGHATANAPAESIEPAGLASVRPSGIQAEAVESVLSFPDGIRVEISRAFGGHGKIVDETEEALASSLPLKSLWIDQQTLKLTLYATHTGGTWLMPKIRVSASDIEVGYSHVSVQDPVPAIVSQRFNFLISGLANQDRNIRLSIDEPPRSKIALVLGLGLVLTGSYFGLRRIRMRREDSIGERNADDDGK